MDRANDIYCIKARFYSKFMHIYNEYTPVIYMILISLWNSYKV